MSSVKGTVDGRNHAPVDMTDITECIQGFIYVNIYIYIYTYISTGAGFLPSTVVRHENHIKFLVCRPFVQRPTTYQDISWTPGLK